MPCWWLTNCPVDIGDFSSHKNWALLNPRAFHLSSSVLENAIVRNRNSSGDVISPCLTPTLKSIGVSTLTMMNVTTLFLYMRLIAEHSLERDQKILNMAMSNT